MNAIIMNKKKIQAEKELRKIEKDITTKNLYLFLLTLKKDFGMGGKRLSEIANKFFDNAEELKNNSTWFDEAGYSLSKVLGDSWKV